MHLTRPARALRAVGAASVSTFAALFAHVAAGGTVPGFAGIAVPLALAVLTCLPLSGRRLSLTRLAVSVVVSQVLFHALFVLGAPAPAATAPAMDHSMHGMHGMHGSAHLTLTDVAPLASSSLWVPVMWIGHVGAAIVTIAALHHAERVLERIAALGARIWATLIPALLLFVPATIERPTRVVVAALPIVAGRHADDDVAPLRGPPVAFA